MKRIINSSWRIKYISCIFISPTKQLHFHHHLHLHRNGWHWRALALFLGQLLLMAAVHIVIVIGDKVGEKSDKNQFCLRKRNDKFSEQLTLCVFCYKISYLCPKEATVCWAISHKEPEPELKLKAIKYSQKDPTTTSDGWRQGRRRVDKSAKV